MPFDPTAVVEVNRPVWSGRDLLLSWVATAPGLTFQVYIDGRLAWRGADTRCAIPMPGAPAQVDIGSVLPAEINADFSGSLPAAPHRRAKLEWSGGTFEGADIAGFHVYGEPGPGAGIDYGNVLADVSAYTAGHITDGYGLGGYGQGGYGQAAANYVWISAPLDCGTWSFAVRPYDLAGNEGAARTITQAIHSPPQPPAAYPDMTRLTYIMAGYGLGGYGTGGYGGGGLGLADVILIWQSSPG